MKLKSVTKISVFFFLFWLAILSGCNKMELDTPEEEIVPSPMLYGTINNDCEEYKTKWISTNRSIGIGESIKLIEFGDFLVFGGAFGIVVRKKVSNAVIFNREETFFFLADFEKLNEDELLICRTTGINKLNKNGQFTGFASDGCRQMMKFNDKILFFPQNQGFGSNPYRLPVKQLNTTNGNSEYLVNNPFPENRYRPLRMVNFEGKLVLLLFEPDIAGNRYTIFDIQQNRITRIYNELTDGGIASISSNPDLDLYYTDLFIIDEKLHLIGSGPKRKIILRKEANDFVPIKEWRSFNAQNGLDSIFFASEFRSIDYQKKKLFITAKEGVFVFSYGEDGQLDFDYLTDEIVNQVHRKPWSSVVLREEGDTLNKGIKYAILGNNTYTDFKCE